jgi:hypothetical protein
MLGHSEADTRTNSCLWCKSIPCADGLHVLLAEVNEPVG